MVFQRKVVNGLQCKGTHTVVKTLSRQLNPWVTTVVDCGIRLSAFFVAPFVPLTILAGCHVRPRILECRSPMNREIADNQPGGAVSRVL